MSGEKDTMNPFYHNPVFREWDRSRMTIGLLDRIWLWIFPTFVQVSDGYAVHFKIVNGAYYVMKAEKLSALRGKE